MDKDINLKKAFDKLKEYAEQYGDAIDDFMVCHGANDRYGYQDHRLLPVYESNPGGTLPLRDFPIKMSFNPPKTDETAMHQCTILKSKNVHYNQLPQINFISPYGSMSSIIENVYIPAKLGVMLGLDTTGEIERALNALEIDGLGSINDILDQMIDKLDL